MLSISSGTFQVGSPTFVEDDKNLPINFALEQNYPNPFNPSTKIKFAIPTAGNNGNQSIQTTLKVYDILGNEVITLVNEEKSAGNYEVNFNASELSTGVYFYTIKAGNFSDTKKIILIK